MSDNMNGTVPVETFETLNTRDCKPIRPYVPKHIRESGMSLAEQIEYDHGTPEGLQEAFENRARFLPLSPEQKAKDLAEHEKRMQTMRARRARRESPAGSGVLLMFGYGVCMGLLGFMLGAGV